MTLTYWSQTHFYSTGYLYGNEGLHVSVYFILLCLIITTAELWTPPVYLDKAIGMDNTFSSTYKGLS